MRPGITDAISLAGARGILVDIDSSNSVSVPDLAVAASESSPGHGNVSVGDQAVRYPPQTAFVLQTSGTTGAPKRVPVSYRNLRASVSAMRGRVAPGVDAPPPRLRKSVALLNIPLSHTSGMLAFCLNTVEGRRLALLDKFDPQAWAKLVRDCRIASAGVPPAALAMLLDAEIPPEWLASLKMIRSGTAPLDPALAVRFEQRFNIPVVQAYGATEFQGLASWTLADYREWSEQKRGSVGRAHPGVELRIDDVETGATVSPGSQGRLIVRTEQSSVTTADGWVSTNDIARIDSDGFLWILGRTDDVINRGGLKVDSSTVQRALESHPSVAQAAVVGLADARLGEIPCAAVVLSDDSVNDTAGDFDHESVEADIRKFLRADLAPYMIPAKFVFVGKLPLNGSLKVDRPAVKDLFG
jgi:long-chain acyl-CoA synthetase